MTSIVDDDVNCRREIPFADVWALAEEARQIIWPAKWPRDPEVKQLFARAALLASTFFSREWILTASRVTKRRKPDHPSVYWVAALRNGLVETQGYPNFSTVEEARSHISQLLNAAAAVASEIVAECGNAEPVTVPVRTASEDPTTADTKQEFLARLEKLKQASP